MREPVHAAAVGRSGAVVHRFDQRTSYALATHGGAGVEILQVAGRRDLYGAAMKQVVRQPDQYSVAHADQAIHRLVGVEETLPRGACDVSRQRSGAMTAVERVVTV